MSSVSVRRKTAPTSSIHFVAGSPTRIPQAHPSRRAGLRIAAEDDDLVTFRDQRLTQQRPDLS